MVNIKKNEDSVVMSQWGSADLATHVQTDAKLGSVGQTSDGQEVSEVWAGI